MKLARIAATLVLAFLLGGSSAEVALHTKRAIERHRAAQVEGSAGELVALEIRDAGGQLVARPRVIAAAGRSAEVVLRDPENPDAVRLALRLETDRQLSGDLLVAYDLHLPAEGVLTSGRVSVTPGVEQPLELGDCPLAATIFAIPVPSAAFDAYLEAERAPVAVPAVTRM